MHAQENTRRTDGRGGTPAPHRTAPAPHPALARRRQPGAVDAAVLPALQRAAGNAAATAAVQRAPGGPQTAQQPATGVRAYEQSVADYLKSGGPPVIYRAIRIQPQTKRDRDDPQASVQATADGNLGADAGRAERGRIYQTLEEWDPRHAIDPVGPAGNYTVAQHVGGNNYGTQYISCTPNLNQATDYAQYNYALGPAANQEGARRPRQVRDWAPVVAIDVTKLGSGNRLVNLGDPRIAAQTDLPGHSEIESMASNDREVLVKGSIPGKAVVRVHGVRGMIQAMQQEERTALVERDYGYGRRPAGGPPREEWDRLFGRNVPEHFHEHFAHLLAEEESESESAPRGAVKREASASPPAPEASAPVVRRPKKKGKPKPGPLSFDPDEM
ncbi:DUF7587 domain-containing protein [Streptomyces tropicalis]|uniref:DUF7587 domain-containing protein n=1 Tax=Streptomyces tropicalis TaxID=3034234 RepID=A0ABT6AES7_9ACTN|nr:hypothetical protein [Streptomyces tropicalis]MDF3302973.1 hypothetical protein [Streptomyces tropicalis]